MSQAIAWLLRVTFIRWGVLTALELIRSFNMRHDRRRIRYANERDVTVRMGRRFYLRWKSHTRIDQN